MVMRSIVIPIMVISHEFQQRFENLPITFYRCLLAITKQGNNFFLQIKLLNESAAF